MKTLLKIVSGLALLAVLAASGGIYYLNTHFPKVSPAENVKIEYTAQRVERGRYLAEHVCDCFGCHTPHDFDYFGAPIKENVKGCGGFLFDYKLMGLPGNIYSRNITPYSLKDWTDGEIVRTLRTGVSKDGHALFNLMPYQDFTHFTQEDIYSLVAYLRTLKPVKNDPPATQLDFPVNFIIKTVPQNAGAYPAAPDKKDLLAYGRYMTRAALCADCHTPVDNHGNPLPGMDFAGGMEFHFPDGSTLRAVNITPDNTGIKEWPKEYFVKRFRLGKKMVQNRTKVKAGDFTTIMPWENYGGMTDEDLGAIYDYLHNQVKPVKHDVEKFTPPVQTASSK